MRLQQHALHVVQISRDVALLRPSFDSEPVKRQLGYARELKKRVPGALVTIIVLAPQAHASAWVCDNLQVVPVDGPLRASVGCLRALHSLHRTTPISVITTQVPYDEAWLALVTGRWFGIPVIGQIHSDVFTEHPARRAQARRRFANAAAGDVARAVRIWAARRTLRAFAAVRTVSSESRTSISRFAETVPLTTIPVPVSMVSSHTRVGSSPFKQPLVIFVGRLAPEKDLSTWLRVARAVSQLHPDTRFQVIGDGPERARLEHEAAALGLRGVLSFEGFVPYSRLREVYARAAALLLTSRSEGFGRVLVEAASQGTPSVSTSLSGPRDVVINGVTGFLHEPGDVEGLTRSVSTLLSRPERAAFMGARARELVTVKFDPEKLRAAWVNLWIDTARAGRIAS
jgi:glycosyltransferase involved in cell wall biosynthesis